MASFEILCFGLTFLYHCQPGEISIERTQNFCEGRVVCNNTCVCRRNYTYSPTRISTNPTSEPTTLVPTRIPTLITKEPTKAPTPHPTFFTFLPSSRSKNPTLTPSLLF